MRPVTSLNRGRRRQRRANSRSVLRRDYGFRPGWPRRTKAGSAVESREHERHPGLVLFRSPVDSNPKKHRLLALRITLLDAPRALLGELVKTRVETFTRFEHEQPAELFEPELRIPAVAKLLLEA